MKRVLPWVFLCALATGVITWGIIGLRIADDEYDILPLVWTSVGAFAVVFICLIYRRLSNRCLHCGRVLISPGNYCPYCGKQVRK